MRHILTKYKKRNYFFFGRIKWSYWKNRYTEYELSIRGSKDTINQMGCLWIITRKICCLKWNIICQTKRVVKLCTDIINKYSNLMQNYMVKSYTICGYDGCGKSWYMQYAILYCYSKGLIGIPM